MDELDLIEQEFRQQTFGMIDKYGLETVRKYFADYANYTTTISELDEALINAEHNGTSPYKNLEIIEKITISTNEYYTFISRMPLDFRKYLFETMELLDQNEDLQSTIGQIIGYTRFTKVSYELRIHSTRPKKYIMQMDTVSNNLTRLQETSSLLVGKDKGKRPIMTSVTLDIPEQLKILGKTLSTYDKSILNGVSTLLENGNTAFSIPMLYQAMTGKANPTLETSLINDIKLRIEVMRCLLITIDLSKEYANKLIPSTSGDTIENLQVEGYLLPLNKIRGTINGKITEIYQIIQNPPLYSYSKLKSQLASVAIKLLNAPVNNNVTTIPLKTYLIQRIEMIKNQKNNINSKIIKYESILEELGELDANRKRKAKIRDYCECILNYFVQENYIAAFEKVRKGRIILGVEIVLSHKNAINPNKLNKNPSEL